jgi:hypothetical protein
LYDALHQVIHMNDDAELLRAARHLIEVHGGNALRVAEKRAANVGNKVESAGHIWLRIAEIVRELKA